MVSLSLDAAGTTDVFGGERMRHASFRAGPQHRFPDFEVAGGRVPRQFGGRRGDFAAPAGADKRQTPPLAQMLGIPNLPPDASQRQMRKVVAVNASICPFPEREFIPISPRDTCVPACCPIGPVKPAGSLLEILQDEGQQRHQRRKPGRAERVPGEVSQIRGQALDRG